MDTYEQAVKKYRDRTPEENAADIIKTVSGLKTAASDLLVTTTDPRRKMILERMIEDYDSEITRFGKLAKKA